MIEYSAYKGALGAANVIQQQLDQMTKERDKAVLLLYEMGQTCGAAVNERDEWKATAGKEAKMRDEYATAISELRRKRDILQVKLDHMKADFDQAVAVLWQERDELRDKLNKEKIIVNASATELFEQFKDKWTKEDEDLLDRTLKSMDDLADDACLPRLADRLADKFEEWKNNWRLNHMVSKAQKLKKEGT